ncbi:MAG: hypothetical protein JW797_16975 [Bradymonadales bacterium]|nr:hypothetical protein [Bradymonadales bacterium]
MEPARKKRSLPICLLQIGTASVLALTALALIAFTACPPLTEVSTGQPPEYPDIQPLILRTSPER